MHLLFSGLENLLEALQGLELKAVGGAVRALLRHDPLASVDLDLALAAPPEETVNRLKAAAIPHTAPGLRWGTVIAQLPTRTVEVTSLRRDAYLAGSRYPTVSFGVGWQEDAQRRDFTFNAIYLAPNGEVFDPFGGEADLKNGLVKFIGDPATRLQEDPLRLLRFFRFCGHYGLGGLTPEVAELCVASAPALATLSAQRVAAEWNKLQATPQAGSVVSEMSRLGLLTVVEHKLNSLKVS